MRESYLVVFWSPDAISSEHFCIGFFESFLKEYMDIQCINVSGRYDRTCKHLMRVADMVVVGVKWAVAAVGEFLKRIEYRTKKAVFLVLDYFSMADQRVARLEREYRIDSGKIARIPYSRNLVDYNKEPRCSAEMMIRWLEKDAA